MVSVAVVGSGISGLICAQTIMQQAPGVSVSVFEWGRGPGGRTARRRVALNGSDVSFDHAAPFFSASTRSFREGVLKGWQERGIATPWTGSFGTFEASGAPLPIADTHERWLGVPTMHSVCRELADGVAAAGGDMNFGRHVVSTKFCKESSRWRVSAHNRFAEEALKREERDFDALVLSDKLLVLPNQYAVLTEADRGPLSLPPLASEGCVVLLVALDRSKLPPPSETCRRAWDVLEARAAASESNDDAPGFDSAVRLIVHESSKIGRPGDRELDLWVVHSGAGYAARHLTEEVDGEAPSLDDETAVKSEMLAEFLRILGHQVASHAATPDTPASVAGEAGLSDYAAAVAYSSVMVWDHAKPLASDRMQQTHLFDPSRVAGVCGDFFMGDEASGVEAAALSGEALGRALVPSLQALLAQRSAL